MPTSAAVDRVAAKKGLECFDTPTGSYPLLKEFGCTQPNYFEKILDNFNWSSKFWWATHHSKDDPKYYFIFISLVG